MAPVPLMAYAYENFCEKDAHRPGPFLWRSVLTGVLPIDPAQIRSSLLCLDTSVAELSKAIVRCGTGGGN